MTSLFKPLKIRDVGFSNRAWVSPMCQYSAENGVVGQWHNVHLGKLATGGAANLWVSCAFSSTRKF